MEVPWDDPLSDVLHAEWKVIANDLKAVSEFPVQKHYFHTTITQPSIHCFADARFVLNTLSLQEPLVFI